MTKRLHLIIFSLSLTFVSFGQVDRWQQRANYIMDIDFDVEDHQYEGYQKITYYNNSPDTLTHVYYHLYLNAFQPNSMMDVRSRTIIDPDSRVQSRIETLDETEIGYERVKELRQNDFPLEFEIVGTILEARLFRPLMPGDSMVMEMKWDAQVPAQIRRTGRHNAEGVDYSMSQWYPKMAEYDYQGWHANPYIGREFYGIWGDFDVSISIDEDYVVGATGVLKGGEIERTSGKKTWNFTAQNVHDFVWAADPDYKHVIEKAANGTEMHFYYIESDKTIETWSRLPAVMSEVFSYIDEHFGPYPYSKYSFIQGGDGGMEYPMATLITGHRSFNSLVGVSVHELMHNWYQMLLATNESLYPWMDEGFTSYGSTRVMNWLAGKKLINKQIVENPFLTVYNGYYNLVKSGKEEPLTTHSDHYSTNFAYGVAAYTKGQIFLNQLEYVIGKENFDQGLLDYYYNWRFKHPNVNDLIRVFEKESDCELDWYKEYWVNSTKYVDYGISNISANSDKTIIRLNRIGEMPMPIDIAVTTIDNQVNYYSIPLRIMRFAKTGEGNVSYMVKPDWPWTHPSYELDIDIPLDQIKTVEIDPTKRMTDLDMSNNSWTNSANE